MKSSVYKVVISIGFMLLVIYFFFLNKPIVPNNLNNAFIELTTVTDINKDLKIKVLDFKRDNYGPEIRFLIENRSMFKINFIFEPNSPPIKIFTIENDNWVEVNNRVTYSSITGGEMYLLFPENSEQPNVMTASVAPKFGTIDEQGKRKLLRIFVFGELLNDGQHLGIPVGAYVDLYVEP